MRYSQKDVSHAFIRFVRAMDLVGIKPAPMEWILEQGSVSNGIAYRIFWRDKATRERHNPGGLESYLGKTAKEATNILDAMAATARWIAHNAD